jgi:hypothetical protein
MYSVFTVVIYVLLSQYGATFHAHTELMAKLLFCISCSSVFWKADMITVSELNTTHYQNVTSPNFIKKYISIY